VYARADFAQAIGAVITGVHGGHVGEQSLACRCCWWLFAANVLAIEAEGARQGGRGNLWKTPTMRPGMWRLKASRVAKSSVGPAVTERDAETLGAADGDVRAEFSGGFEEREGEKTVATVTRAGLMSFGN